MYTNPDQTPADLGRTRALVLAGGGAAGNAWQIGLIAGLADAGVDLLTADLIVGTSAGSTVAAQVTGGVRRRVGALGVPEVLPACFDLGRHGGRVAVRRRHLGGSGVRLAHDPQSSIDRYCPRLWRSGSGILRK